MPNDEKKHREMLKHHIKQEGPVWSPFYKLPRVNQTEKVVNEILQLRFFFGF
jgi:hypothetical protein